MKLTLIELDRKRDYCSEEGARVIVAAIRAYWRARGHEPHVWAEPVYMPNSPTDRENKTYVVRSNIHLGRAA